jgi:dihydroxyacetone kinase DhaKLM complex PTS-EIIA-like component DhaM
MAVNWIKENKEEILHIDLAGIKDQEILIEFVKLAATMVKAYPQSSCLVLADFTNTALGAEVMTEMKKAAKEIVSAKSCKTAVLGITGLKKILYNGYVKFTGSQSKAFENKADALRYLLS